MEKLLLIARVDSTQKELWDTSDIEYLYNGMIGEIACLVKNCLLRDDEMTVCGKDDYQGDICDENDEYLMTYFEGMCDEVFLYRKIKI